MHSPKSALTEPKSRGANRSTKAAGKLKVLPEQPELAPGFSKEHDESITTAEDGDDGDIEESDEEQEDVEARIVWTVLLTAFLNQPR